MQLYMHPVLACLLCNFLPKIGKPIISWYLQEMESRAGLAATAQFPLVIKSSGKRKPEEQASS